MRRRGFIAVDRGALDHPILQRPERYKAWQWLIAEAAWKPEGRRGTWGVVHLERGQLPASVRILGKAWGWPKSNVHRFLQRLIRERMVRLIKTGTATGTAEPPYLEHEVSIITICNYDQFQSHKLRSEIEPGQQPGQQPDPDPSQSPMLPGFSFPQPLNQSKKDIGPPVDKKAGVRLKPKPRHGAHGRGFVWCDYPTDDWKVHAKDHEQETGTVILPEARHGGSGNWFYQAGEAARPQKRRYG